MDNEANLDTLDTLSPKKQIILRCYNNFCQSNTRKALKTKARPMIPIYYLNNHSETVLFYVCKICTYFDFRPFVKFDLNNNLTQVSISKFPFEFSKYEDMQNSRKDRTCPICDQNKTIAYFNEPFHYDKTLDRLEPKTSFPIIKKIESVFPLFIKTLRARHDYIGFLCMACKRIYFIDSFFSNMPFKPMTESFDSHEIFLQKKNERTRTYNDILKTENPNRDSFDYIKKDCELWNSLTLEGGGFASKYVTLQSLGLFPTNTYLQNMQQEKTRKKGYTITLKGLTELQARKLIEVYGTEEEKKNPFSYMFW